MVNNKINLVDKIFFKELANKKPQDVCTQASCKYDDINKAYTLSVWGDEYIVYPYESKIDCIKDGNYQPHEYFYLFIIFYLLNLKKIKIIKEWISEKDIPGGSTFFRGPHEIPTNLISEQYKNDIEAFRDRCVQLGGVELDLADTAYSFNIVPNIPIAVLYWEGDDDFLPEAKILYDRTIIGHLSLDIIFALAIEVCVRIGKVPVF